MNGADRQFCGLPLRNDIGQAMVDQGLRFLRYGGTMVNAPEYRFKRMIGDRAERPPYKGHWYTYSTNGFGIEDFLHFCEKAGFMPAYAVNVEESAQDMADMIEYLNGSVDTKWGKKRAENGHPEPYGLKYLEIGNEEVIWGILKPIISIISIDLMIFMRLFMPKIRKCSLFILPGGVPNHLIWRKYLKRLMVKQPIGITILGRMILAVT